MATSSTAAPPLSQAFGYGIVLGLGLLFALFMITTTFALKRYRGEVQTSEEFNTAGRTVKSGLVASAVCSSWTWAATLLQSSSVAYRYGVSGPFWYASGATVQIIMFASLAIELKKKAPHAHTFLEVARARYGTPTHVVLIAFGFITNFLVTAMLVTGGSAVTESLSGVPTPASCFLIPVGVLLYTIFGGLKATMISDYIHTVVVLTIIFMFAFSAYATNEHLGSPGAVWDGLVAAAQRHPVAGNKEGSYLTMQSREGAVFFVINIVGAFGNVCLDNGYYNKAIAASPADALPGYIMGGLSWFAIPWLCSTTMGLAAVALENHPVFPTYPHRISEIDVTFGLVLPYTARALLGSGGAIATFFLVFFAVTSAYSSELISISSIWTYDIYQTYIDPKATGKQLIWQSHLACIVFATVMSCVSVALYHAGIGMGYLYLMMGVIISPAVLPAVLTFLAADQSALACVIAPILGLCSSIAAWLATASQTCGALTIECTGSNDPMLAGNVVGLLSPLLWVPLLTYVLGRPQRYDWLSMRSVGAAAAGTAGIADGDVRDLELSTVTYTPDDDDAAAAGAEKEAEAAQLARAGNISRWMAAIMTVGFLVLWPLPIYGSGYVFSRGFFTGWIVVGFLWLFGTTLCVGVYPLWESRETLRKVSGSIVREVFGKEEEDGHD